MKKSYSTLLLAMLMLITLCSCSVDNKQSEIKNYTRQLNAELSSFAECANEFSYSVNQIADAETVPSKENLDKISESSKKLSEVCTRLQTMKAPDNYADSAKLLSDAMEKYISALKKCDELVEFYRQFDSKIREYKDPIKGGEELQNQAQSIFQEFYSLMQQATISFHSAENSFNINQNTSI